MQVVPAGVAAQKLRRCKQRKITFRKSELQCGKYCGSMHYGARFESSKKFNSISIVLFL